VDLINSNIRWISNGEIRGRSIGDTDISRILQGHL